MNKRYWAIFLTSNCLTTNVIERIFYDHSKKQNNIKNPLWIPVTQSFFLKINQQNQQEKPSKTKNLVPGKSRGECIAALLKRHQYIYKYSKISII